MIKLPKGSEVYLAVTTSREDVYIYLIPKSLGESFPDDTSLSDCLDRAGINEEVAPLFLSIKKTFDYVKDRDLVIVDEWQGVQN